MFRPMDHGPRLIAAILPALALVACGSAAPGGQATTAPTGKATPVTASYSELVPDELAPWGAVDGGIFKKDGLDVTLDYVPSANGIAALVSGEVQIAGLGGSEVMSADAGGSDLVVVANLVPVYPYLFMVPADIQKVADLKGRKVGVSKFGSSSDVATRQALQREGLNPTSDVTLVQVGSAANRVSALKSGAIQGGMAQPPDTYALQRQGMHALFDVAKLKLPAANTVLAVTRGFLTSHRSVVQAYVDSLVQAVAYERGHRSFTEDVMAKWQKLSDRSVLGSTYGFYMSEVFPTYPYPRAQNFQATIKLEGASNPKLAALDPSKYLDASFVQSAANRHLAG
jgi:NitT/TauT family transport system substrate-binding protein